MEDKLSDEAQRINDDPAADLITSIYARHSVRGYLDTVSYTHLRAHET